MANVMFKRGTQASLETLLAKQGTAGSYVEGAFYLTTDSDRLYFAQSDKELVHLNHNVIHVATVNDLPTFSTAIVGDFYYCANENVLCTKKTGETGWTQINKNTDNDTRITGVAVKASADKDNNTLTFKTTLTKQLYNGATGLPSGTSSTFDSGDVVITQADLDNVLDLLPDVVVADFNAGKATIKASQRGAAVGTGITVVGDGSVVTVAQDGTNGLKITGKDTTYKINKVANEKTIKLTNLANSGVSGQISFNNGTDIEIDSATADAFTFNHKTYNTPETVSATKQTPSHGNSITAVTDITANNGHITKITTTEFALPADKYATQVTADTNGNIKITRSDNSTVTSTGGVLYYTVNGQKVVNGGNIDFYTKAEIDELKIEANAMVYRGVINSTNQSTIIGASGTTTKLTIGDTYKVDTEGTVCGYTCKVGDLLIANGTEGTDGKITSASLKWDYVPSGNDVYNLDVASNKIQLKSGTSLAGTVGINSANDSIAVTTDVSNTNDKKIVLTHSSHEGKVVDKTAAAALTHNGKFKAVTAVTSSNGHVDSYDLTEFTLPADNDSKYAFGAAGNNNAVELTLTGSASAAGSSSKVTVNAGTHMGIVKDSANSITINHVSTNPTKEAQATGNLSHGGTFVALTKLESTDGHVGTYQFTEFTLPTDNNNIISSLTNTYAVTNSAVHGGKATNTITYTDNKGVSKNASSAINSSSLRISAVSDDAENGTSKTDVYIDLVWGSF